MKNHRCVLVFAVLFACASVPAYAATIDFNSLTNGNTLSNQFQGLGVLFSSTGGPVFIDSGATVPVGSNIAGHYVDVWSTTGQGVSIVTFVDPSNPAISGWVNGSSIGVDLWNTEGANPRVTVIAYDINNNVLGTYGLNGIYANGAGGFSGQVHTLKIVDTDSNGFVYDNLTFGAITDYVPEPGTFMLLGTGLIGLSLALRRRRKRA